MYQYSDMAPRFSGQLPYLVTNSVVFFVSKREKRNLQFWPECLGAMLEYWYLSIHEHQVVGKNSFRNVRAFKDRVGISKCWFLRRAWKLEYPEKNLSIHIWRQVWESNPGNIDRKLILVPLRGSFENFRQAPSSFLYGSPCPPQERIVSWYLTSCFFSITRGSQWVYSKHFAVKSW